MQKMLMAVALIAATIQPAWACHHFRVWHYRFPQRCSVATGREHRRPIVAQRGPETPDSPVKAPDDPHPEAKSPPAAGGPAAPDPGPPLTEEEEHAVGVEQLKKALEKEQH
jgi:hypothetical protein